MAWNSNYLGTPPTKFSLQHSEQFTVESAEKLQVRTSTPDLRIGWMGPGDPPDWLKKLNRDP